MPVNRIVLDTNCLLAILSRRGNYFSVWQGLHEGKYTLCVSNEILEEYEEIICSKTNPIIASNVIQMLINSPYVQFVDTYFHFHLIEQDKDDNKFVDCAIAANARFIISAAQCRTAIKFCVFHNTLPSIFYFISFYNLLYHIFY